MTLNSGTRQETANYETRQTGTLFIVTLMDDRESEDLVLFLNFESSRVSDEQPADQHKPTPISATTFKTTLKLEPGKPTLVGSFQSGETGRHYVVTVTREDKKR